MPSPGLYSYCRDERVTSLIHIMTGEVWETSETVVSESFIRGYEVWVRSEGGNWQLCTRLDPATARQWKDAYRNSPFYFRERGMCEAGEAYWGAENICFEINIPGFYRTVYEQEIALVESLHNNMGSIWIDLETRLPRRMDLSFYSYVRFPDQDPDREAYNVWNEINVIYHSFNEDFAFPNPEGAQA